MTPPPFFLPAIYHNGYGGKENKEKAREYFGMAALQKLEADDDVPPA